MLALGRVTIKTEKMVRGCDLMQIRLVPKVGLEPTRYRYQRILSPPRLPIPPLRHMERVTGIEPASPAWKAGALAVVLHPHMVSSDGIEPPTLCL